MKTSTYLLLVAAAFTFGMPASAALAQDRGDDAATGGSPSPQFPPPAGVVDRYRITYWRSSITPSDLRSASIVSITNQSIVTCVAGVEWRNPAGALICRHTLAIPPGNHRDFCTRPIPAGITICDSICAPNALNEGSAIVGSSTTAGCERIAVSARTVYTPSTTDSPVSAITDAKVVRLGAGNSGD